MNIFGLADDFREYALADQPRLFRIALGVLGDREDAHDAVQETLLRVARKWSRLDSRGPHGYATRVLVNLLRRRYLGKRARDLPLDETDHRNVVHPAPSMADAVADAASLESALRTLSPRQRMVVFLRHFCDLSERETADLMKCSVGTVKSQNAKALHKLRQTLGADNLSDSRN